MMRTVEVKSVATNITVTRCHFWSFEQVKQKVSEFLPSGEYLIQGTNSSACNPRISRIAWESAEKFTVNKQKCKKLNLSRPSLNGRVVRHG
jgi:hypothetical protein